MEGLVRERGGAPPLLADGGPGIIPSSDGEVRMGVREVDDGVLDDLSRRGLWIYENKLQALLEPHHNGEALAIHVESEDFTVARSTGQAMREIRRLHPVGELVLLKIGTTPEYGLEARLEASLAQSRLTK